MLDSMKFLNGGGEMAVAIRNHDWSATGLGFPQNWPPALKTAVSMALNSKFPKCIVWGPDLVSIHNDAFRPILGDKPALGRSFRDVWSEAWHAVGPIADRAYAGQATFIEDFPLVIDRYGYPEQCYFTFCYSPIRDEHGVVHGLMDTVIETTGKIEAQRQARLLNGELEHRIKNALTVIQAIINQTFQSGREKEEILGDLGRRIGALADAQTLLTRSSMAEADIGEVVNHALAPFRTRGESFHVEGTPVSLSAKQALSLSLALNELATNALKYGALSRGGGIVKIAWKAGRPGTEDEFRLDWSESGGPPVSRPTRRGFGSRIIDTALPQDFMGEARLSYDPDGVRYALTTQMIHVGADPRFPEQGGG
ncbi:MAG: sensor histidine kinase [Aquamicrobium sp.]|uniref:sensor histidine kinase n=1 Tax=Aquamicrobium sp. TaxID=1872579 RepID=UPI00349E8CA7|nr:sensor histidine kinase [Aquamicrobium sp.]